MMIPSIKNNCLGFTAKIKFVDSDAFDKIPEDQMKKNGEYVGFLEWDIDHIVSNKKQAATDSIACCNAGGITNGESVSLFHLLPNLSVSALDKVKSRIDQEVKTLKQSHSKLTGLILGGYPTIESSVKLFDNLKKFYEENKVTPSIFWGQPDKAYSNICYSNTNGEDTWYVNTRLHKNRFKRVFSSQKNEDVTSLKQLKTAFKQIKLSPEDELFIGDTKISPAQLSEK